MELPYTIGRTQVLARILQLVSEGGRDDWIPLRQDGSSQAFGPKPFELVVCESS